MKKILATVAIMLVALTACTQYVFIPIPGFGDNNNDSNNEESFVPDATTSEGLTSLLTAFESGSATSATIRIADGVYELSNGITVGEGKSLTIIGESDNAIVNFDNDYYTDASTTSVNGANYFTLIHAGQGSSIQLENVTIRGRQVASSGEVSSSNQMAAILADDADVYMDGVVVEGLSWINDDVNGLFGMQTGFGIRTTGTEEENEIIIRNSIFRGFQKCGILIGGTAESANNRDNVTLEGNTVIGVGNTTVIAQNGMQISVAEPSNITSIRNNTIRDINYTTDGYSATGIMLVSDGNHDAEAAFNTIGENIKLNNTFVNVPSQVYVYI